MDLDTMSGFAISVLMIFGGGLIAVALFDIAMDWQYRKTLLNRLDIQNSASPVLAPNAGRQETPHQSGLFSWHKPWLNPWLEHIIPGFGVHPVLRKNNTELYRALSIGIGAGLLSVMLVSVLLHSTLAAIGLGFTSMVMTTRLYLQYRFAQFSDLVYLSLPQIVDGLIRCLKAGFDLNRSLSIIASEVPSILKDEFRLIIRNRDLGQSIGAATYQMANRLDNSDAVFLATLIATQEKSGGPLIDALASLSQILKDRERLRQKRRVASSEARMSAIILGGLPVIVALVLFSTNPSYRDTLLSTESGRLFLALGVALLLIGSFVMSRMIRIGTTQ